MNDAQTRITVNTETPGCWRATLDHPPINTVDDRMYDEIYDLVERIEASLLAPYGNAEALAVARQLDDKVVALLTAAAE